MEGFSYHNIFDTKGIEYLVVIGFLLLIIPFWITLNKPEKLKKKIGSFGVLLLSKLKIPQGLFYSKNHTWTYMKNTGYARIGLDDLLLHLTGAVEVFNLKTPGEKVRKGDSLALLIQNGKQLDIVSPISGEIKFVNSTLFENPGSLNDDPYEEGWFYELKPEDWVEEIKSYFLAEAAIEWTKREMARFKDFIVQSVQKHSPETGRLVLQEGGELSDHPLSEMPNEIWQDFQASFMSRTD